MPPRQPEAAAHHVDSEDDSAGDVEDWEDLSDEEEEEDSESEDDDSPKEGNPGDYEAHFASSKNLSADDFAKQVAERIGWKTRQVQFGGTFKFTK
jgi:hypothetical protein